MPSRASGRSTWPRGRNAWWPTRAPSRPAATRTCRPRSGPGASGPGSRRAASSPTPPTGPQPSPRSPSPAARTSSISSPAARPRDRSTPPVRSSTPAPTPPDPASRTSAVARCTSTIWGRAPPTAVAEPESDTVTYGLADFVAAEEMSRMRGYWWSPDGRSLLVARVDDAPGPPLAHRRSGQPRAGAHGRRLPRRGHAERAGLAERRRARRHPGRRRVGRRPRRVPRARRVVAGRAADRRAAPRPAGAARPARRPGHRGDRARARGHGPALGRDRPRRPRPDRGRRAAVDHRRRHRAAPARRRRAPHPAVAAGPRRARRRRRHGAVQRLRRPGVDRAVDLVRGGRAAVPHPGTGGARRAADRRDARRGPAVARCRRHRHDRARRAAVRSGRSPRSRSRPGWSRGSPCTPPASGRCGPRCCCRRGTGRERRCRCSWTPTAGRTPSAWSPPAART